jgi:peptidoglycan-associated lipoprotein
MLLASACSSGKLNDDARYKKADADPGHIKTCCTDPNHHFPDDASKVTAASTVYFDYDQYLVSDRYKPVVRKFADYMKLNPEWQLRVEGNTDDQGGRGYNFDLGLRRANSVTDMLIQFGVAPSRLTRATNGMGRPQAEERTAAARARNQRVEFKVTQGQ